MCDCGGAIAPRILPSFKFSIVLGSILKPKLAQCWSPQIAQQYNLELGRAHKPEKLYLLLTCFIFVTLENEVSQKERKYIT